LKRGFDSFLERLVDVIILNLIFGVGMVLVAVSVVLFAYGNLTEQVKYMDSAAHLGLVGAALTVIFGFIRRLRSKSHANEDAKVPNGGQ
jgi:hypothetical protein